MATFNVHWDISNPNQCALCGVYVQGSAGGIPRYFCTVCFGAYETDIIAREPWVNHLLNKEKSRRKRRNTYRKLNIMRDWVPYKEPSITHKVPKRRSKFDE